MKFQRFMVLVLMLAMTVAVVGCASSQKRMVQDQTIADQIKMALESPDGPDGPFVIDVIVNKGVVTLDGKVRSYSDKDQAMDIAQEVEGVKEVKSFIVVK